MKILKSSIYRKMVKDLSGLRGELKAAEQKSNAYKQDLRDALIREEKLSVNIRNLQSLLATTQTEKDELDMVVNAHRRVIDNRDATIKDLRAELKQVNARAVNFANLLEVAEKKVKSFTKAPVAAENTEEANSPYVAPISPEPMRKYKKVRHGQSGV